MTFEEESIKNRHGVQLRAYHPDHPAKSTIYEWVGQNRIPYGFRDALWCLLMDSTSDCGDRTVIPHP